MKTPPTTLSEADRFRARRLAQVCWLSFVGLLMLSLGNGLFGAHMLTVLILLLATLVLGFAIWHLKRYQNIDLAAGILLWSLALVITLVISISSGLRDPALLGYPAILIFAALFCRRRQFMQLFAFLLLAIIGQALAHILGWRDNNTPAPGWDTLLDVTVIMLVIGFSVRLQAYDLRQALMRLELENQRFRESEAKATYLAQYDALTGLPNRSLCEDRFNQILHAIHRHGGLSAVLFVDLDNFKTINDSLGHSAGDEMLRTVATSLRKCIRATDTACRFGGDEFIVLLTELRNGREAERIAAKILRVLARPRKFEQHQLETSASIGIALVPGDGTDFESYCKNADLAMYQAKTDGKNLYRFFDAAMNRQSEERYALIAGLRKALKNDEFVLYYQPKMCLQTNQLMGAEALIRWHHPERGLLTPALFIELAEETGLIVDIGSWVLRQACQQCRTWQQQGFAELHMAVNLSPMQFTRGQLEDEVAQALDSSGLEGRFLELELTESLLLRDAEAIRSQLDRMRTLGISFSIDDFGTGYSNLGYLSKFNLESLKIDQSFVRNMEQSTPDLNIVQAIINIAKSLGLHTVAEGIETPQQLANLIALGCDLGQGYHWSRPLPAEQFQQLLQQYYPGASA